MLLRLLPPLVFFDFFVFFLVFCVFFLHFQPSDDPFYGRLFFFLVFFLVPTNEWTERAANDELHWTNQTTTNFTLRNAHGRWFIHRFTRDSATKTKTKQSIWHRCLSLWVQKTRLEFFFFVVVEINIRSASFERKQSRATRDGSSHFLFFFCYLRKKNEWPAKRRRRRRRKWLLHYSEEARKHQWQLA